MKKIALAVLLGAAMMFITAPAFAQYQILDDWKMDLTGYTGGKVYSNIDHLTLGGWGVVTQSLGSNGTLDVGDAFTEYTTLTMLSYVKEGSSTENPITLNDEYYLYAVATGLSGNITEVNPDGSIQYSFTPGVGELNLVLSTDELATWAATLSTLDLINPSAGVLDEFMGGADIAGTTNLTMEFLSNDIFKTSAGDFIDTDVVFGLLNTNNLVKSGNTTVDQFGNVTIEIDSAGQFNLARAVPEPASMILFGSGLVGMALRRKKRS